MATAVASSRPRPVLVASRKTNTVASFAGGKPAVLAGDLTIHRITKTHHGRTLLTLGHAAEYLTNSRRYSNRRFDLASDREAVHLLMRLSRGVFDDFAERRTGMQRFETWLIERVVRLFE
jgi:hypothetical protein